MTSQTRRTLLSLAALPAFIATGCTAHETSPKTAQTITTNSLASDTTDLFIRNENLQTVYFENGKSEINPAAIAPLRANVDWLKKNLPLHIEVAGYSDGHGTPEQNLAMGQRRAASLRDYYVAMGIPRSRISTITLGQEEPVCMEQTEECAGKNRRAETLIENKTLAGK